ncbi:MAG TPA: hypothetical protein VLW50_17825 [Streptosporangiaceae bacterium]|nr:hypothetical protein [Streptosporangiaceae bacterium]
MTMPRGVGEDRGVPGEHDRPGQFQVPRVGQAVQVARDELLPGQPVTYLRGQAAPLLLGVLAGVVGGSPSLDAAGVSRPGLLRGRAGSADEVPGDRGRVIRLDTQRQAELPASPTTALGGDDRRQGSAPTQHAIGKQPEMTRADGHAATDDRNR